MYLHLNDLFLENGHTGLRSYCWRRRLLRLQQGRRQRLGSPGGRPSSPGGPPGLGGAVRSSLLGAGRPPLSRFPAGPRSSCLLSE